VGTSKPGIAPARLIPETEDPEGCGSDSPCGPARGLPHGSSTTLAPLLRLLTLYQFQGLQRPSLSPSRLPSFSAYGASDRVNRCAHCPQKRAERPRGRAPKAREPVTREGPRRSRYEWYRLITPPSRDPRRALLEHPNVVPQTRCQTCNARSAEGELTGSHSLRTCREPPK
jgi:hypothetical protein